MVDLPAWIQSGNEILDFIAREPAYRSRSVGASDIATLLGNQHFSFLLNGWNEIAELHSVNAISKISDFERAFPAAGIIVATRTHYLSPPLPGCTRIKLLSLTRRQRADYLRQTLGDRADELRLLLENNRVLDYLTRTPLILTQVVTVFQSGRSIPDTRVLPVGRYSVS